MPRRNGKKRCSEGASCPYKHEHQHQMEFYHDDDDTAPGSNVNSSSFLSSGNTSGGHSSFQAFSGSGRSLGSGGGNTLSLGGRKASTKAGRGRAAEAAMRRAGPMSSNASSTRNPATADATLSRRSKKRQAASSRRKALSSKQDVIVLDSDSDDYEDISEMNDNKKKSGAKRKRTNNTKPAARKKKSDARTVSAASSSCDEGAIDLCDSDDDDDDVVVIPGRFQPQGPAPPAVPASIAGMSEDLQLARAIALSNQTTNNAFVPPIPTAARTATVPSPFPSRDAATSLYGNPEKQLAKAIAHSNRDVMEDQDKEYYESLIADREKAAQKKREQQAQQEKEEMDRILELSRKQAQQEEQQRKERKRKAAEQTLEPEPSYEDRDSCCFIAFRLPTTAKTDIKRVSRRFRQDASVSQLFLYLRSLEELQDVEKWTICKTVGGDEIIEDSKTTLAEAGFSRRVVLIVKDENV